MQGVWDLRRFAQNGLVYGRHRDASKFVRARWCPYGSPCEMATQALETAASALADASSLRTKRVKDPDASPASIRTNSDASGGATQEERLCWPGGNFATTNCRTNRLAGCRPENAIASQGQVAHARKMVVRALEEGATSESRFGLLEHIPVAALVFEVIRDDFVLCFVNAQGRAMNPDIVSLLGKPMGALYRDQPDLERDAREALANGLPLTRDIVVRRYDHTEAVVPVRLTWVPLSSTYLAVYTQIQADRVAVDAALRESEARYRGLFASLPDAVVLRSADGRILACNEAATKMWSNAGPAELLGRTTLLGDHLQLRTESGLVIREEELPSMLAIRTAMPVAPIVYEAEVGAKRGWLRVAAQPIFSADGKVTASVTVVTDLTERIVAERELRAAMERLDLALAAGRMGVCDYDSATDAGWWSENLNAIFSIRTRRARGMETFLTLLHPEDAEVFQKQVQEYLSQPGNQVFNAECRIVGDDGVVRWARLQSRRVPGSTRYVGTAMDITELRRMEDELRRSHRLESIGRLAGGMAHDFNNLLAAMLSAVELMEPGAAATQRPELETIRHAVLRARDLIKQLLAFARKQTIEFRSIELGGTVTAVERMLRPLLGPGIEIEVAINDPVVVRADPASLEQVLVNLVVNAKEAMPNGGRVLLRVGRHTNSDGCNRASIEVVDSGPGMDEATKRRVFDPFFTTKPHGTGLGLASSYGIITQHGGDISVESELGFGTRFRVLLPLDESGTTPIATAPPVSPKAVHVGCALVVDDEDLVRRTAERVLRSLGYSVLTAASAADALQAGAESAETIDVMLCDVAMPGRDGLSLASEMLTLRPNLRVIFASGYTEHVLPEELKHCLFLAKPYTRAELLAKLDEVCKR